MIRLGTYDYRIGKLHDDANRQLVNYFPADYPEPESRVPGYRVWLAFYGVGLWFVRLCEIHALWT